MSRIKEEVMRIEEEADKIRGIRIEMEEELQNINLCSEGTPTEEIRKRKLDEPEAKSTQA